MGGVDSSISSFINHGCHGTYNIGEQLSYHEMDLKECDLRHPGMICADVETDAYDPFWERQYPLLDCQSKVANRDIDIGEEMLDDYMCMGGTKYLCESIKDLQNVCSGGIGFVTQYEDEVLISNATSK